MISRSAIGVFAAALGIGSALGTSAVAAAGPDRGGSADSSSSAVSEPGPDAPSTPARRTPGQQAPPVRGAGRRGGKAVTGALDGPSADAPVHDSGLPAAAVARAASIPTPTTALQAQVPMAVPTPPATPAAAVQLPVAAVAPAAPPVAAPAAARNPAPEAALVVAPVAAQPAALTAPPITSVTALPSPLLGDGTGAPTESPAGWVVLAAVRRGRWAVQPAVAATVTTGQAPKPAATTGTTTTVTWNWGTNPVLAFNPSTDKLDFGWMGPTQFDVSDTSGSTVISVVGNNHTYTLQNVGLGQLQPANIVAKDAGTVSKWQTLIAGAQTTVPAVSIANATVAEGNSGTTNAAFAVTLSKASTKTVTVGYSTANGTATAGSDFTAASGTLTFTPGVTSQKVNVAVAGDTAVEPDETFTVKLANAVNATLGTATATGTITNDDAAPVTPPTVSIANSAVAEGNSGTTNAAFAVTLSKASDKTVTVGYSTANGTATAGSDYTAAAGTLTFAPGTTTQQVNVAVTGDTAVEPDETFSVTLSTPVNVTLATAAATGAITNDDSTTPPPATADRWGRAFYAPYVDMGGWPVPDLVAISQTNGGGSLFTAAFMQADPNGKLAWAGLSSLEPGATNDQAQAINRSIKALQDAGGDVMVSLGGQAGTSLAQWGSTHGMTAAQLANAYAGVVDTYGISHLDFDIEGAAVADPASIALNSQALKLLQQSKPAVQVWYTLPVLPTGLTADGLKVVDSALKAGVNLAGVNVMAMDYGESAAPTSGASAKTMGAYAVQSAESTYGQLTRLYSGYGKTFGYSQLGVTPMLGVNDITSEVFTPTDAQAVEDYARAKSVGMIGLWSVTRDTPGPLGVSTYTHSGMSTPAGSFAKIFNDYGTVNALKYPAGGSGGSSTPVSGGTTTTVGWHWGTTTTLSFNTTTDKLDFGWMQPTNFDITESAGSTVITILNNSQTYVLKGVGLRTIGMGNIVALDSTTLAKWQAAITATKV